MSDAEDDVPRSAWAEEQPAKPAVVRLYEEHHDLLLRLLTRKFGVPEDEAESLIYQTLVIYQMEQTGADPTTWLIAGVSARGQAYQRANGIDENASTRGVLAEFPHIAREAMRLRFVEGCTYPEIAAALGVNTLAAQRLVTSGQARLMRHRRGR